MLELGPGADILRALGWAYWGLILLLVGAALWFPERWWQKVLSVIVVLLVFMGPAYLRNRERQQAVNEYKARYAKAKAVFDERCKTAGEKVYRTVNDVEGVLLLNVRPNVSDGDRHDPNWADAGLPDEPGGEDYIANFLKWEYHKDKRNPRGTLIQTPSDLPGYRYVDVKEGNVSVLRYTLKKMGEPGYPFLKKTEFKGLPARYAVSYSNLGQRGDGEHWVAGTMVTVTDTQTAEVLAQAVWYSFVPSLGTAGRQSIPWAHSVSCPDLKVSGYAATRFFVDQVLKPKKGE